MNAEHVHDALAAVWIEASETWYRQGWFPWHLADDLSHRFKLAASIDRPFTTTHPLDASQRAVERHYTAREIARAWGKDPVTIRRLFQDEPGVLKTGKANRRDGKRDYVSLSIPESVVMRVHRRRSR